MTDSRSILVIDNYDSFTFNLVHYLTEMGADVEVVRNDAISAREALALERSLPIDAYDDARFETKSAKEWLSSGTVVRGELRGVWGRAFKPRRFTGKAATATAAEAAATFCGDGVWLPCAVLSYDESKRSYVPYLTRYACIRAPQLP